MRKQRPRQVSPCNSGHSEHTRVGAGHRPRYQMLDDDFDKTEAFKWLDKNAHKYGFILRYPKTKLILLRSNMNHGYRFVGPEHTKIKEKGLHWRSIWKN